MNVLAFYVLSHSRNSLYNLPTRTLLKKGTKDYIAKSKNTLSSRAREQEDKQEHYIVVTL